jgi:hypothetical protein
MTDERLRQMREQKDNLISLVNQADDINSQIDELLAFIDSVKEGNYIDIKAGSQEHSLRWRIGERDVHKIFDDIIISKCMDIVNELEKAYRDL